jgi:hypothetical protein
MRARQCIRPNRVQHCFVYALVVRFRLPSTPPHDWICEWRGAAARFLDVICTASCENWRSAAIGLWSYSGAVGKNVSLTARRKAESTEQQISKEPTNESHQ